MHLAVAQGSLDRSVPRLTRGTGSIVSTESVPNWEPVDHPFLHNLFHQFPQKRPKMVDGLWMSGGKLFHLADSHSHKGS